MADYNKLKGVLLDVRPRNRSGEVQAREKRMDQKRELVDGMFKYLDTDGDGHLGKEELAQVGVSRTATLKKSCLPQRIRISTKSRTFSIVMFSYSSRSHCRY